MQNCMFYAAYVLVNWHPVFDFFSSKGDNLFFGEQNLKKYQEESTKVSKVSVSRIAFFLLDFSIVFFQLDD